MPAVRSARTSTVRRESGLHTIVAWDDISSFSSDSSSSSNSSLPTPPQSPRPARRRLTRKKKSANGPVSNASLVSLPSGNDVSVEFAQHWLECPFETDHRLFRRLEVGEGWMTDSLKVDLTGENPMMEKSVEQEFSHSVDDISVFFQTLQCDGPSGRKATGAEEFPRIPYPSGLEDHDMCFPPTPETPFMATVPLPYESYADQYFENSVFVASSHISDESITDNPDLTSSSCHASHAQVFDNLLGLSLF